MSQFSHVKLPFFNMGTFLVAIHLEIHMASQLLGDKLLSCGHPLPLLRCKCAGVQQSRLPRNSMTTGSDLTS